MYAFGSANKTELGSQAFQIAAPHALNSLLTPVLEAQILDIQKQLTMCLLCLRC